MAGALRHVAEPSVGFFIAPPLPAKGPLKDELEGWFATFRGPIGYELRDVKITASDDLAFSHGFIHITGTKSDGELPDVWFRETLCFRKSDGQWRIAHARESVPYYMDDPAAFRPEMDIWVSDAQPWDHMEPKLPKFAQYPPDTHE